MPTDAGQSQGNRRFDFSKVTEVPGLRTTPEAFRMLQSRYAFAAGHCDGKDVLEVACGAGQGLGYLAKRARRVVGGDYTRSLLQVAGQHYRNKVALVCLDAHSLPFPAGRFDVVILFEAIYYLADAEQFVRECRRVLRPDGLLLLCTANKKWPGFTTSPLATRYFDAEELRGLFAVAGFVVQMYGAFPEVASTGSKKAVALIRSVGVRLNLIPGSLKGREWLKRLFYGPLSVVGWEIDEDGAQPAHLYSIEEGQASSEYRVLYAAGQARNQ